MRAEKKWPGDRPDLRDPPDWGGDGIWVCWKRPSESLLEGKKYPKVRLKAEKRFGCGTCDKDLKVTKCKGPRHFDNWTMEAIKERFGGRAILEAEPPEQSDSGGGEVQQKVEEKAEVIAQGKVEE